MNNYRKTNKQFFLECAYLRNLHGLDVLTLETIEAGMWLTEKEIEDFTMAYMSGGEL
jgi:hypothetical protein